MGFNFTTATFRLDYPEFQSQTIYPERLIDYYTSIAGLLLNTDRWDQTVGSNGLSVYDIAAELMIAHNIALRKRMADQSSTGGTPGLQTGILQSKSVGGVSAGYTTQQVVEDGAGFWAMTEYGSELWQLIKMFGAGPVQVGVGCAPPFATGSWLGPWPWPLPSGVGFSS